MLISISIIVTIVLIAFVYVTSYHRNIYSSSTSTRNSRGSILVHIVEVVRREGNNDESFSKPRREKKEFTKNNQRNERQGMKEWQSGNSMSQANNRPRGRRR